MPLLRAAPAWLKPALAYAEVVLDETGEIETPVAAARAISRAETAELYDSYLNDVYRSLKSWRRGNELAARVQSGRSLRFVGELVFALRGVRAPYPEDWHGTLDDLESLILAVARTQELCRRVRARAAEGGYADVYASWDGELDRVLAFRFA